MLRRTFCLDWNISMVFESVLRARMMRERLLTILSYSSASLCSLPLAYSLRKCLSCSKKSELSSVISHRNQFPYFCALTSDLNFYIYGC